MWFIEHTYIIAVSHRLLVGHATPFMRVGHG
jgi:hypothetical protein